MPSAADRPKRKSSASFSFFGFLRHASTVLICPYEKVGPDAVPMSWMLPNGWAPIEPSSASFVA